MPPKIRVSPIGRSSADLCLWRSEGVTRLTAIAKATFAFIDHGVAQRIPPSPVFGRDRHVEDNPRRSTVEDFQVAPLIPCAGVTLQGSAYPFEASTSMSVRLGLYRDDEALIEKTLHVFGERAPDNPHTSGLLGRTPLVYERAAQGPLNLAGNAMFNVAHATDPALPGCFAPVPLAWRARVFGRRALDPATMKSSPMQIPPGFDFMFFSSAPADQRVASLRGDEWIILDGLSPSGPRTQTQLPSARGLARFEIESPSGMRVVPCDLALDTIGIDSDRGMMSIVFRGHVPIDDDVTRIMVHSGVETPGELVVFPAAAATSEPPRPAQPPPLTRRRPPPPPEPADLSAADDDDDDDDERGETVVAKLSDVRLPALPFKPAAPAPPPDLPFKPTATADALPSVVPSTEPELTPMRRRDRRAAPPVAATPWDKPAPPRPPPPRQRPPEDETVALARSPILVDSGLPFAPKAASIRSTLPSAPGPTRDARTSDRPSPPVIEAAPPPDPSPARFDRTVSVVMDATAIDIDPAALRAQRHSATNEATEAPAHAATEGLPATRRVAGPADEESIEAPTPRPPSAPPRPPSEAPSPRAPSEPPAKKPESLRDRVEAAAKSGGSIADFSLVAADLTAIDLAGHDLSGIDFAGANLSHARLANATLDRANLERANLEGADLTGASMRGTVLRGAAGPRARLDGAKLDEADLRMSKFPGASFDGASLGAVQASRADLTGVDLTRANLSGANFRTARMADSKLVDATVDRTDFRDALLTRCDFTRVDRSSARFQGANTDGIRG